MGNSKSQIVSIEGNIGSGKSTLLGHLKEHFKGDDTVVFLDEPVKEWESIKDHVGKTMLEKFYADQDKYAFSFQMMAYISRLALLKKTMEECPGATIITERSLYTDKFVFAKMLYDMGKIEDVNYQIYTKWFDTFLQDCELSKIIYVKAKPTVCHERVMRRSRNGEDVISLEYLERCGVYHDYMISENSNILDTLVLDGDIDIRENAEQIDIWREDIIKFIDV